MATVRYLGRSLGSFSAGNILIFGSQSTSVYSGEILVLAIVSASAGPGSTATVNDLPTLNSFYDAQSSSAYFFRLYSGNVTADGNYPIGYKVNFGASGNYVSMMWAVRPDTGKTLNPLVLEPVDTSIQSFSVTSTTTLNSGDVVVGVGSGLGLDSVTLDSDTTDGVWENGFVEGGAVGQQSRVWLFGQTKVVTGGQNQTFNGSTQNIFQDTGRVTILSFTEVRDQPYWGILA